MLLGHLPDRPPTARAHRRLRAITGLLAACALVAVLLQYTRYALLPHRTTDTLWGILVGIAGMGIVFERRWAASVRRNVSGR